MIREWIEAIRIIVREEIKFMQKYQDNNINSMSSWTGVVATVNSTNNTATILLPNETTATSPKQNKTGQTLLNGDEVILFSMSGKLSDSFIMVAKKKYINN